MLSPAQTLQKAQAQAQREVLELTLLQQLQALQLQAGLEREWRFHPSRKWRFDLAYPSQRLAIEVDGGVFSGGRHTRGTGFTEDCVKLSEAAVLGWRVIRATGAQVRSGIAAQWIEAALSQPKGSA